MTAVVQNDTKEGKVLRDIAKPIPIDAIQTEKIKSVLKNMRIILEHQKDGVAIAAPQIGKSLSIFVISPKVFENDPEGMQLNFINPEIIKSSSDKKLMDEGCLSVRWWYGKVRRASRVTVRAHDKDGNQFEMEGSGLLAQIFQHEIDHLNGILFIDTATDLKEMEPNPDSSDK